MIPTAEEILQEWLSQTDQTDLKDGHYFVIKQAMFEFAKMHAEEALQKAYENADLEYYGDEICYNKDSIINAYPLENIK
jgi:hypothetical protein